MRAATTWPTVVLRRPVAIFRDAPHESEDEASERLWQFTARVYGQVRELAEVRHVTRASDTDIRRAVWDAIVVGGLPYVVIRAEQCTQAAEVSSETTHDGRGTPGANASIAGEVDAAPADNAPFDDDIADGLEPDTADNTASERSDGNDDLPELVSVGSLQLGWIPLPGR